MKKCLHLKKTKPHWKRKPTKVITWRDRIEVKKKKQMARHLEAKQIGMLAAFVLMDF